MSSSFNPSQASKRPKFVIVGNIGESLVSFRGALIKAVIASGIDVIAVAPDITKGCARRLHEVHTIEQSAYHR